MEGYKTINGAKKIYWTSSNPNNPFEITRVVYSDHNGALHDIWPSVAELTKVYLVRITKESTSQDAATLASYDECIEFHLDSNGEPLVTMLPYWEGYKNNPSKHNAYALKGDIKVYETVNGQRTGNYTTLTDCYFFSETRETKPGTEDGVVIMGEGTTKYGARPASYTANHNYSYSNFATFIVSDEPGESQVIEPQCGFYSPEAGYVQLGYVFDPNYQSRLWLKRATVNEAHFLSDSANGETSISSNIFITQNDSLTIYPRTRRHATAIGGWQNPEYNRYFAHDLPLSDVSYDASKLSITKNNDGSFTITPIIYEYCTETVDFGDTELYVTISPEHAYSVTYAGNPIGSMTITTPKQFLVKCKDWSNQTHSYGEEYTYTGTLEVVNSNPSAVSISGRTITPNTSYSGESATIQLYVGDQRIAYFTVTVGAIDNVYYQLSSTVDSDDWANIEYSQAHPVMQLTNNNSEVTNCYDVSTGQDAVFAIKFAVDSAMTSPMNVFIDMDGESCLYDTTGQVEVYVSGENDSEIFFEFRKRGSGSLYDFDVRIPVCSDAGLQNKLGEIVVSMGH